VRTLIDLDRIAAADLATTAVESNPASPAAS
jgi:hypothetical protein